MKIRLTLNQDTHRLKRWRRSVLRLVLLALLCSSLPVAQAAPGDVDTSFAGFGNNGVVIPSGLTGLNDIAVQPDGKVVVVGFTAISNQLAVYRYPPNGRPDTTFGSGGQAIYPDMFRAATGALQNDGKIVVGGTRDSGYRLVSVTGAPLHST